MTRTAWVPINLRSLATGVLTSWDGGTTIWDAGQTVWDGQGRGTTSWVQVTVNG